MKFSGTELLIEKRLDYYNLQNHRTGESDTNTTFGTYIRDGEWHFVFACTEPYPNPKHNEYNAPLYEGDIVEIMVTLGDKNRYLEIEVNLNNANYCAIIENSDGKGRIVINLLKENPIISEVSVYRYEWTCDIIVDIEKLKTLGFKEEDAYFNAFRQDFDNTGYLNLYSLKPAFSDTFHVTDAFIKARFDK